MASLVNCPNCSCIKSVKCESQIGLPIRNTFTCTTCSCIYKKQDGETWILKDGKAHGI